MGKYIYGLFGSGDTFWKRVQCHIAVRHDWEFLDAYGLTRRCRRCGLFREQKLKRRK